MARPSFKTLTGEDAVQLHVKITESQWNYLDTLSDSTGQSKGAIVRNAIEATRNVVRFPSPVRLIE